MTGVVMSPGLLSATLLLCAVAPPRPAASQDPKPAPSPVFASTTDVVNVTVSVRDDDGNFVADLTRDDFLRILTEPKHAITKQYAELLATEGVTVDFTSDGIEALADIAFEVNHMTQNIGARRLHTILERVVEDLSFNGPDLSNKHVTIDAKYVRGQLAEIIEKEDKSNPLSDEDLVTKLQEAGYPVARRTVTKYRKMADIPSSRQRKEWTA